MAPLTHVEKAASGFTTVYIFSGGSVIAEYASGASPSSPQKEYVYAGGSLPIAEIDSGSTVKYYEADTLSVRLSATPSFCDSLTYGEEKTK